MPKYRVVTVGKAGQFLERDFEDADQLRDIWEQTGVEEDSYTLRLHGQPIFKGLIGPISDGPQVVRYEAPDAFATLTEIWAKQRRPRKRRST